MSKKKEELIDLSTQVDQTMYDTILDLKKVFNLKEKEDVFRYALALLKVAGDIKPIKHKYLAVVDEEANEYSEIDLSFDEDEDEQD